MSSGTHTAPGLRWRRRRRGARADTSLRTSAGILGAMMLLSLFGLLFLDDPNRQDLNQVLVAPGTAGHLLGTDPLGRDVLAWVAAGIRTSILVSAGVVLISATFGVLVGVAAGYFGGWADSALMRVADLQLAIPPLLLFLAAVAILDPTTITLVLLLSAVGWVPYARLVRTRVQVERDRGYVAAARLAGTSTPRILLRMLPVVGTTIAVLASLQGGYVLLWESALSFLGLGVRPPTPSLGFMIAQGRDTLVTSSWVVTVPGVAIVLLVLAFNMLGDGLRDRFHVNDAGGELR